VFPPFQSTAITNLRLLMIALTLSYAVTIGQALLALLRLFWGVSDVLSSQLGGRVPCDCLKKAPAFGCSTLLIARAPERAAPERAIVHPC
jgi:hypothetical protein